MTDLSFAARILGCTSLIAISAPAWGVELNATLKGVVVDADGLEIPDAEVRLSSPDLLGARNELTDEQGRYRFNGLPPGEYRVEVVHPGFQTWKSGTVTVVLSSTMQLDIQLSPVGAEVVTVEGRAGAVDVESVSTGAVLDSKFLKNIPNGRSYHSAISSAPGLVGGANPNSHGSFDSSNQYYLDGVNITDPVTNTFSTGVNYDAIEAVEVLTGGMDAEYGRALGGAFNIVTKSGGNNFEGTAVFAYSNNDMVAAPELEGDSTNETFDQQLVLNLGGPILKDKIWFFASFEGNHNVSAISIDPAVNRDLERYPLMPYDFKGMFLFGKITAQPVEEHRVWAQFQMDPTVILNTEQSAYVLPSGETMQAQGGWLGSLGHQFTPSEHFLLETQLYYQSSYIRYNSILWRDCENRDDIGACTDDFVGTEYEGETVPEGFLGYGGSDFSAGEYPYASFNRRNRMSLSSSLTSWFDFLGEHEAKIGLQGEYMTSFYVYPGLDDGSYQFYTSTTDDPNDLTGYQPALQVRYDSNLETQLKGSIFSFYVQDVYKPIPRLTLRPGVRLDLPILQNDQGDVVFRRLTVAPRFGAAFDLTGDKKTKVQAYYGRFYDSGFLGVSDLLNRNPSGYSAYSWDAEAGDWATTPDYSVASGILAHDDLRNPYSDEFNVGIARELGKDWGLDATFSYEVSRRFWEDDEVNLIWNEDGTDVVGYRNGTNEAVYRLRTPDDAYTKYTSVELVARKQFSDNFGVLASYTWSHAIGTNDSDLATGSRDIAQQIPFEDGLLSYDIPHHVKLSGSYSDDDLYHVGRLYGGYTLGFSSFLRSGAIYRPIVWNDYYQSYNNYESVSDGRYRLPMRSSTDLRFMLDFEYRKADGEPLTTWGVGVDCFNVFNDRTITDVNTEYDPAATGADQTFGRVEDRQSPRYFQFVARGEF